MLILIPLIHVHISGETRAAMSDGASSGDESSIISEGAVHIASGAYSFLHASSFPSISNEESIPSDYTDLSKICKQYYCDVISSISLSIIRLIYRSSALAFLSLVYSLCLLQNFHILDL